ncbi:DUF221-domain-containing protein [Didymella exigua CBS 183.55]|uniref:DUF221-domain-containing protein n=1 Tax=Didymella exigua CBS 183.55 TaxID=1150837 RepID=A0A6A5S0K1_9PLEO|nr:DUF221-domain-containing protein [Didymella exigua CBS 183.55]KAF1934201.1 DUF221-domain-containing protein [Didymella exigua CBS 183.55]
MDFQSIIAASNGTDTGGKSSSGPSSFKTVAAAFVPTFTLAALFVSAFVVVRPKFPKIYFPRTYLGTVPKKDHTPCQSRSYWGWVHTMRVVPDKFTLYHQSIDSYLFLRFLRTMIFICVVGCVLTWPILMPINAAGGGTGNELDRVSIGNVADKKYFYAHAIVAWVFFSFVMFTVARERLWLIGLRQAWSLSKRNANRLSSQTVLFLSAPTAALDQSNMRRFFGDDAVKVWPVTKAEKLQSLVSSRDSKVNELETAEISLIQKVNEEGRRSQSRHNGQRITYGSLPDSVKQSLRPTQRLKTIKPVGKQVDSISFSRDQLLEKEEEINKARESNATAQNHHGAAAVFVQFRTQSAAQKAYQQVTTSDILSLTPRFTGISPSEVFWDNLTMVPTRRISQRILAHGLVIALIIFWSIPVAFVGAVSNVSYLAENFEFLGFLNELPDSIINLLTGLVPPLLLSALSKYIPKIFRYIFTTFGEPTKTSTELKVLKWYYVFQVLQVFLVVSLSSGAAAVISQIAKNPSKVPELLAERLPRASNSYLTYFVVQGLTSASDNLLNYSDVLSFLFFDKFFDKTPRQKFNSYTTLRSMQWGKLYPKYVNFVIIAIVYSCIAPLVLGFAAVGLVLFYFSYLYMLLYTAQPKIDTKGHCYTLSLQHMLTGVYIAELCLIGLFSLRGAFGPTVLLGILLIVTIIFTIITNRHFAPLEQYLPTDLALDGSSNEDSEEAPLLSAAEEGQAQALEREESRIHRISSAVNVSPKVTGPIARFFEPHIFASHRAMKQWLRDGDFDEDNVPEYSDEDIRKAYLHPAYTSQAPVIWLAKDDMGVSKKEIQENENRELKSSDDGAWIDKEGNLKWSVDDFEKVPIFKKTKQW